ncbi:unnamed protein product [Lupinus luteus]|uniref:Uncharacterized protein n=1 Tax=Lupinus luteus TaxID=3873 RepID=A0AAV1Y8Y8_LUPLU
MVKEASLYGFLFKWASSNGMGPLVKGDGVGIQNSINQAAKAIQQTYGGQSQKTF